jgi:hypothetical protein
MRTERRRSAGVAGIALGACALAILASRDADACSSCGCTLNSEWSSQGFGGAQGWRLDFRYDYFNQDQLRSGTGTVDRGGLEIPNEREIQQKTVNHNYTALLDWGIDPDWGLNIQLPYFDRFHSTIAEGDTDISTSHSKSIGDIRVVGRYQGLSPDKSIGLQFGLKLPTGSINVKFNDGPQAGEPLDRGLQPGTGTTDLLLGGYTFGALSRDWDYFAEGLLQAPLNYRDEFKPGTGFNLSAGLRYMSLEHIVPQVQINMRTEGREKGANADIENSGATLVYLSPGISGHVAPGLLAYAFLQVPIYQRVNGFQLEPRYSVSAGLSYAF